MSPYYLGLDVGSTYTRALIANEQGQVVAYHVGGPGNRQNVGWDGFRASISAATRGALADARLSVEQIAGAGFGIAGFDWEAEKPDFLKAIATLGLSAPVEIVNDALIGLLAGSHEGWGVAVVSGTGCNCWGRNQARTQMGHVTGNGLMMGEGAGATELIEKAVQAIAHEWTRRGPPTKLTPLLVQRWGARDVTDLLQALPEGRIHPRPADAPLVFQLAAEGDAVARDLIRWAGCELGELAITVIRQLSLEAETFDVILVGSMFSNGEIIISPLREKIHGYAPGARLIKLQTPPAVGAVLLGMETGGLAPQPRHATLIETSRQFLSGIE